MLILQPVTATAHGVAGSNPQPNPGLLTANASTDGSDVTSPQPNLRLLDDFWSAYWITHPTASTVDFGVFHFRKEFDLDAAPETFVVNVSADNRYKLYVNGREVTFGPARGDLAHWHFETVDIAPFLQSGVNVIAAVVWNYSVHRPWAQFSIKTGFLLQGNGPREEIVNTNNTWKVTQNPAFSPITDFSHLQTFIVVGPGERVDASLYPWDWEQPGFDATGWFNARQLMNARPRGIGTDIDCETGMLGPNPYWNFVDWADEWPWDNNLRIGGVPSGGMTGNSSILTLQLAYTLNRAAELMDFTGDTGLSSKYRELADSLNQAVLSHAWCDDRQLIADTPDKDIFSQHANIFGILSGALDGARAPGVMEKVLTDQSLIQATMYFRFYLFRAMLQTGHGNLFAGQLGQWEDMLDTGLTTFAERPEPTRSDCHAWSASPLYFFLSGMAGITPAEPSFKSVRVEPHPGELDEIDAGMPHPGGEIKVRGRGLQGSSPVFSITLPDGIPGKLIWGGQEYTLRPGANEIRPNN